jgi:hypothetical protein
MDLPEGNYTYRNIGVQILGWHLEPVSEWILECESDYCLEEDHTEDCYYWDHDFKITDLLEVVYVGDDTRMLVYIADLVKLEESQEICSCGQVVCWARGTDYE